MISFFISRWRKQIQLIYLFRAVFLSPFHLLRAASEYDREDRSASYFGFGLDGSIGAGPAGSPAKTKEKTCEMTKMRRLLLRPLFHVFYRRPLSRWLSVPTASEAVDIDAMRYSRFGLPFGVIVAEIGRDETVHIDSFGDNRRLVFSRENSESELRSAWGFGAEFRPSVRRLHSAGIALGFGRDEATVSSVAIQTNHCKTKTKRFSCRQVKML